MSDNLWLLSRQRPYRQFFNYALISLLTNLFVYGLYLLLTYLWDFPKLTMTALYFVGASIGFLANRCYTF